MERDVIYVLPAPSQVDLCAQDALMLAGGAATMHVDNVAIRMAPGRRYTLSPYAREPALIRFVANFLNTNWDPIAARSKTATIATQGDEGGIAFRLAGLDGGKAQLSEGNRAVMVTFTGPPDARGTLTAPDGRVIVGKAQPTLRSQAPRILFEDVGLRTGERWTVRIGDRETAATGSFVVVRGPLLLPVIDDAPAGDDGQTVRALALAGSDPDPMVTRGSSARPQREREAIPP